MALLGIALRTSIARFRDLRGIVSNWDMWKQSPGWLAFALSCEFAAVALPIAAPRFFSACGNSRTGLMLLISA